MTPDTQESSVFDAIADGDLQRLRALLHEEPRRAGARRADGLSALRFAAYQRNAAAVTLLRAADPELDLFDAAAVGAVGRLGAWLRSDPARLSHYSSDGWTALHLACFFGQEDAARELLRQGAPVDAVSRNEMANTPLHAAAAGGHAQICRTLLDRGAPVNATQSGGWTALHSAAGRGDEGLVDLLLERGADPRAANDEGQTPAETAEGAGHRQIAERLRRSAGS